MTEEELERYNLALRTQFAERHALWEILQELIGRYAVASGDAAAMFNNLHACVIRQLDLKDADAARKGLDIPLAAVKVSVDRFFSGLSKRSEEGDL